MPNLHYKKFLFIYLGVLRHFQHCTGHITTGSWKGRGNQYIQFVRVLYCKLPTNSKQLPAFPLEAVPEIEPGPQRWDARVLPLCHRGPDCQLCFISEIRCGMHTSGRTSHGNRFSETSELVPRSPRISCEIWCSLHTIQAVTPALSTVWSTKPWLNIQLPPLAES